MARPRLYTEQEAKQRHLDRKKMTRAERRAATDIRDVDHGGRPKETEGSEFQDMLDVDPYPLSALLRETKHRMLKYEGVFRDDSRVVTAMRTLGIRATTYYVKRAESNCEEMLLAREDVKELESAVADCRGVDMLEREVYTAMMLKHGTPSLGRPKKASEGVRRIPRDVEKRARQNAKERQKRFRERRKERLERVWSEARQLLDDARKTQMTDKEAVIAFGDYARSLIQRANLLWDEINTLRSAADTGARHPLARERVHVIKEMRDLGLDPDKLLNWAVPKPSCGSFDLEEEGA